MKRSCFVLCTLALVGCVSKIAEQETDVVHTVSSLPNFNRHWSYCHRFYASTEDDSWVLSVGIPKRNGTYSTHEVVELIDLRSVPDRSCAVSQFKGNDIACSGSGQIVTSAASGDVHVKVSSRVPAWESTADIALNAVLFVYSGGSTRIDSARFSNVVISNFCAG